MSDAYDHVTVTDTNTLGGRREATSTLIGRPRAPGGDAARALRMSRGCVQTMRCKKFSNDKNNKQLHKWCKFKILFKLRLAVIADYILI